MDNNLVYLLLGIAVGIIICIMFYEYIIPIIQLKMDVYKFKKSDEATEWNIKSKKRECDFNKEYPESLRKYDNQEECNTNAIGFHYEPEEGIDDEDYCEDKKEK